MSGVSDLVQTFVTEYKKTPQKLKVAAQSYQALSKHTPTQFADLPLGVLQVLDAFMVYALLTAAVQVRVPPSCVPIACLVAAAFMFFHPADKMCLLVCAVHLHDDGWHIPLQLLPGGAAMLARLLLVDR